MCEFSGVEKYGECPSSETPTYDHTFDLTELECCSDLDCPDSYKCCKEADYEKPYYSLCKPPIFTYASEDEKQSFDEPVHSGEGDTLTEDDTEIDFVSSYRDDSGSGSGSGSGSKEYSHEFGSQDMTHYDEEIKKEYGFDGSQNWKPGSGSGKEIDGSGSGDNSNENVESLSNDKEPIDYATDDFSFAWFEDTVVT